MAYTCPRCGAPVQRGTSSSAQIAAGLVGALFYAAFGAFQCKTCGKIAKSEFSTEDQAKMTTGSVLMSLGAVGLLVLCIVLLGLMK